MKSECSNSSVAAVVDCRNHPAVLGENNANLPKIVSVVAEAFQHEALTITSEVGVRLLNIARLVRVTNCLFSDLC